MVKLTIALWVFAALWTDVSIAQPDSLDDIYTTRAVVTGKDERNRPVGFKLFLKMFSSKYPATGPS
jgi:hypothetical protein